MWFGGFAPPRAPSYPLGRRTLRGTPHPPPVGPPRPVAVFGAGSGLGAALGRRFGKEGFRVALVARRAERLDAMVGERAADGIEAAASTADLSDPTNARPVVDAIRERFGRIDVVSYQPLPGGTAFVPAVELDAARLAPLVNLFLLTPVEIAAAVLPEMTERGDGGFIVTGGFTAADPQPYISGIGPAMSAVRNFVLSLHGEVAGAGVYAGVSTLAALVKGSESYDAMTPEDLAAITGGATGLGVLDPDELGETYWRLYTDRDRVEYRFPAPGRRARRLTRAPRPRRPAVPPPSAPANPQKVVGGLTTDAVTPVLGTPHLAKIFA